MKLCERFRLQFTRQPVPTDRGHQYAVSLPEELGWRVNMRIAHDSKVQATISDFVRKLTYPVCAVAGHLFAQRITTVFECFNRRQWLQALKPIPRGCKLFCPGGMLSLCACQQLTVIPVWCAAHFNWIIYMTEVLTTPFGLRKTDFPVFRIFLFGGLSCFIETA